MGRASSQKKVARAATTGGGRTPGTSQSLGWYATLAAIVVLGLFLVAFSRNEELNRGQAAASKTAAAPKLNSDNWHSTFSVYICDHFAPVVPLFESVDGIDTVGDGVIDIRPYTPRASGSNATLGFFVNAVAAARHETFKVSSNELQYIKIGGDPQAAEDTRDWHNGDKCPNGQPGKVQLTVQGAVQKGDPATWKLRNGDYLDLGFVTGNSHVPSDPLEQGELTATPTVTPTPPTTAPPTTAPSNTTATTTAP